MNFLGTPSNYCDSQIAADPLWNHQLANDVDLIYKILGVMSTGRVAMATNEALNLYRLVQRVSRLDGNIAELGSYMGGSALIMALANKSRKIIRLFDTFSGIPRVTPGLDIVQQGIFSAPGGVEEVRNFLNRFIDSIAIHQGTIPETFTQVPDGEMFSLINLDLDVYQGTLDGLSFFYERMNRGGAIVVHDYHSQSCPGVKVAVDEFFDSKPETVVDLWHTQVVIIKI